MKGTWQTTSGGGGGGGGGGSLVLIVVIVAAAAIGSGAASAAVSALEVIAIIVGAVIALVVLGGVAWLVWRVRLKAASADNATAASANNATASDRSGPPIEAPVAYQLPPARRPELSSEHKPAIEPPRNEQHLHLHLDGADPEVIAAIMRRINHEEDL